MHFNAVAGRLLADVVDIVGEAMMPSDSETDGEGRQIFRRRHHHHVGNAVVHRGDRHFFRQPILLRLSQIVALPDRVARQAFLFDIVGFCEEQVLVHNVLVTVGDEAPTGVNSY